MIEKIQLIIESWRISLFSVAADDDAELTLKVVQYCE